MLNRINAWIADGTLGTAEPNAADLQIATSIRLLMTLDDVGDFLRARPAGQLAARVVPEFPGRVPPVLPAEWLAPVRGAS
jgi:glutathione S-transferase